MLTSCVLFAFSIKAQDTAWTYEKCLEYALSKNIDVKQSDLDVQEYGINYEQSKLNRLPSVSGTVSQSFGLQKDYNETSSEYESFGSTSSTSYGVSADVTLYNGLKLKNKIAQSELQLESKKLYSEKIKESIELSILDAYLSILYAQEEANNAEKQIEATEEQLRLAKERLDLGIVSRSDYLKVKSELASEKLTLATAQSNVTIKKLELMQLMELPVVENFEVEFPVTDPALSASDKENPAEIFQQALQIKPQIKQAELDVQSTEIDEKIAKADMLPELSLSAGVNTGWSSGVDGYDYSSQLSNSMNPNAGLTLSVPIFQKGQVKNSIKTAKIATESAKLDEVDAKNTLRKEIEQAVVDNNTAKANYNASIEQYEASKEAYAVAEEKYGVGVINTVDFMLVKSDLIEAESSLLQQKYNLLFSAKIIDFYKGTPIRFSN